MSSTILTVHRQYVSRPKDEDFRGDLNALIATKQNERQHSRERVYNLKDLQIITVPTPKDDQGNARYDLHLQSARGSAPMSHWAFGQLARTVQVPAGYLRTLDPKIAADALNYGILQSPVGTTANLLVRGANGQPPIVRACTSEKYGRLWDAELYSAAQSHVFDHSSVRGGQWQAPHDWSHNPTGVWAGDRDSFVIRIDGGSIVTDPSAGQDGQMSRGVMIKNSEVGDGAVVIECILFRYICGNLMIWGATIDSTFRRRHVGTGVLRDVIRQLGSVAHKWTQRSASQDEAIIRGLIARDLANTREGVIDELRKMNFTKEQAETAYDTTERTETRLSPRSFWGIAQGVTRMSQQAEYQDAKYDLDKLAAVVMARGAKLVAA